MDLFAGRIPTSSRIGPRGTGAIRRVGNRAPILPPSADVVFVQFSDDCIRDATGVWLKSYVVDGIQYILSFADPTMTEERGHQSQLRTDDRTARWHGANWKAPD